MADKQISQLVAATTLNNEDLLVIQQGQVAKKLSGERLAMFVYLAAGSMIDEVNSAVEEAQAAVDELLEEKNAIAQTIADMAGLGTDTTLTTPGMAADSKAVGDRIADVEKDALAGLNQKTISDVAIASFDDGADDAPVKELIVNINPIQDLHGQDAPYPAGGGVNKLNPANLSSYGETYGLTATVDEDVITISGTYTGSSATPNFRILRYTEAMSFSLKAFGLTSSDSNCIDFLGKADSNRNITCGFKNLVQNQSYNIKFRIVGYEGTEPSDYSPHSNICPITGWTGCEVGRAGKNLIKNIYKCYFYASFTKPIFDGNSECILFYAVKDEKYTLSSSPAPNRFMLALVGTTDVTSQTPILSYTNIPSGVPTWTAEWTGWTLWFMYGTANASVEATVQLEVGSSATDYEAPNITTLSVTFPSEAGTVYGAKLNLTTGKLIVDTAARQFDGSGDVYSFVSNGRVNIDFAGIDYKKGLDKDSGISNSYAGLMQTANNANFDSSAINYASCYNISSSANNFTVRIKDPRFVDLNTAQGIFEEEPLVIIFNLNTPIVYNLTPIEVRTLLKINNIWANTGNINTLIYRTIPITEEVIREIMGDYEGIIAGVESTGKATKNYYAGDLVIVNDILYKCLVNVASGETFTPGAGGNVSQTTIADELATLQALYDNLGNLALLSYTTA